MSMRRSLKVGSRVSGHSGARSVNVRSTFERLDRRLNASN